MVLRRVWVVEEVMDSSGNLGQRQSECRLEVSEKGWNWIRPDERLDEEQRKEWDRVMSNLKNVKGEDLRHIVCASGLLDHCLSPETRLAYIDTKDKDKKGKKDD